MQYPKWLKEIDEDPPDTQGWGLDYGRLVEMAKDAWAMCYLRGTGGGMGIEKFLHKYNDAPENEIPYVAFDHPNDGAGI